MSERLRWYWHRLAAMGATEMLLRLRQMQRAFRDARVALPDAPEELAPSGFPSLPARELTPASLRSALTRDALDIRRGQWVAFGHLTLGVDTPPEWHRDYLAGCDLSTSESGFRLNHRRLSQGADIKLVWELSRWQPLTRLAMAAYVLGDHGAAGTCVAWLNDWVTRNPPYRGWNWTSALEAGMRLIQFAWIDALLEASPGEAAESIPRLRAAILPAHVRYVWRHRSFGSSANNHLLGELAGCILAVTRWPALAGLCAPLEVLQTTWEREVLAQFDEDGGNREQALNYHLFSLELCWHTSAALQAADREPAAPVVERLARAIGFYGAVQAPSEPWDFGDSDSAFVVPVFVQQSATEWRNWCVDPLRSPGVHYWLGSPRANAQAKTAARMLAGGRWRVFQGSGIAVWHAGPWWLRWDASPLGYLSTAAHGHLDALHLSVWYRDVALVVDPGTGAYYGDVDLRRALASRGAHNGPSPAGHERPARLGPFLWAEHHPVPELAIAESERGVARLDLWGTRIRRSVTPLAEGRGFRVEDGCEGTEGEALPFRVRWQFAPDTRVTRRAAEHEFEIERTGVGVKMLVGNGWSTVRLAADGLVSPAFRSVRHAPYLELIATPGSGEAFHTTFIELEPS